VRLLLERALRLHGKFGGHDCDDVVVVEEVEDVALVEMFLNFRVRNSEFSLTLCATRD
jgi:hypothetical protein